jgi:hypothetical protein
MVNILEKWREKQAKHEEKRLMERSEELYQICEHENELWLTFDGRRVLPESMLNDDALTIVAKLRTLFLERHGIKY